MAQEKMGNTEKKSWKQIALDYVIMTAASAVYAVGIAFFLSPNSLAPGGVTGIAIILNAISGLETGTLMWLINIPLILLGMWKFGWRFILSTLYCTTISSLFTNILEPYGSLTRDPFLAALAGSTLMAVGMGWIFKAGATTGGTDIIALILKKYSSLNVGKALLCTDFLVAVSSFWVFGVKAGLYSLLGLFAKAFLVDGVIESINSCKYFIVITKHPQPIEDYILKNLHHGCTINGVMGTYTGENKTMMHTVCKRIEAVHLQKKVYEIDPHAFTIITTTSEIIGRGFRSV